MKRLFIMLTAISLLTACNNNKPKADTGIKEKDDYLGSDSKDKGDKEDKEDSKNTGYSESAWSASDIKKLEDQCAETFKDRPEEGAKMCPCLIEKFSKLYSSYAEMDRKTSFEEGKRLGNECRKELGGNSGEVSNTGSNWPQSEKDGFISSCVGSAMKKGKSRAVSQSYCDCMLNRIESLYPDYKQASNLTDAEVDRIIEKYKDGCLEEN
ncbi:MAG: hypothetical protein NTW29_02670 [Bacteroidetes bacterium]|nr:hypothetical protein [Bacteroidota bacterium]